MYLIIIFAYLINFFCIFMLGRLIGRKGVIIFCLQTQGFIVGLTLYLFIQFCTKGYRACVLTLYAFLYLQFSSVDFNLTVDAHAFTMLILVNLVALVVVAFSVDYLYLEPDLIRFLAYVQLFVFFMLITVVSSNFLLFFAGWEGVGLMSYLLIGFWSSRLAATKSAVKAIVLNKVGDCALIFCISICYLQVSTVEFYVWGSGLFDYVDLFWICLLIAAMAKSAQVFFHPWLAEAMEGPTPVSALIHAATMVTVGLYTLGRFSFLQMFSSIYTHQFLFFAAGITILFAGCVGCVQIDLKRVIAFSTCSQLGYMFISSALNHYSVTLYHLFLHGYCKALLFLTAGLIIHIFDDNQDIRKYGGVGYFYPQVNVLFLVGSATLIGIPFLSMFFSKDLILEGLFFHSTEYAIYVWGHLLATIGVCLTTYYSIRAVWIIFMARPLGYISTYRKINENACTTSTYLFLTLLALFSIFSGWLIKDLFVGPGALFFSFCFAVNSNLQSYVFVEPYIYQNIGVKFFPFICIIGAWLLLWQVLSAVRSHTFNLFSLNPSYYTWYIFFFRVFFLEFWFEFFLNAFKFSANVLFQYERFVLERLLGLRFTTENFTFSLSKKHF